MAITYTWSLTSLKKKTSGDLNDIIVQTYWQKKGTDGDGNEGTFSGATPFDPDQVDPENFTTFEDLTEEQVLDWIKAVVVGNYEQHVNEKIAEQIEAKKNPVIEVSSGAFPWSPPSSDTPANTPGPV